MNCRLKLLVTGLAVAFGLIAANASVVTLWRWGTIAGCTPTGGVGSEVIDEPHEAAAYYYSRSGSSINSYSYTHAWGLNLKKGEEVLVTLTASVMKNTGWNVGWIPKSDNFIYPSTTIAAGNVTTAVLNNYIDKHSFEGGTSSKFVFTVRCTAVGLVYKTYEIYMNDVLRHTLSAKDGDFWTIVASNQGGTTISGTVHTQLAYSISVKKIGPIDTPVTVSFDLCGGTGTTSNLSVKYGDSLPAAVVPTRFGYDFVGYFDAAEGGTKYYDSSAQGVRTWNKSVDATLYAQWTSKTYQITYSPGALGVGSVQYATKTHGVLATLEGELFTRPGYVQTGWTRVDGSVENDYVLGGEYPSDAACVLYPVWTKETFGYKVLGDNTVSITNYLGDAGSVVVPSYIRGRNVSAIGNNAFCNNTRLTTVKIEDGVASIGMNAFSGCSGIKNVTLPSSVTNIGSYAFKGCANLLSIEIPTGMKSINYATFYGCVALTNVVIPASVSSIGAYAFYRCQGLSHVDLPTGLTDIGESVFAYCYGLTSVSVPQGVTSIGFWAFFDCTNLTCVTIPSSVKTIDEDAFTGCSRLAEFVVAAGNWNYKSDGGLLLSKDGKTLVCGVNGDVLIPSGVTGIGASAFYGFDGLTSVRMPSSVTSIGDYAFAGCTGLTEVEIPSSVASIGEWAFYGSGLTSVEIPVSVVSLGSRAFGGCKTLSRFVVDEGNPNYKSVSGFLLTKDGNTLICGVCGDAVIPGCVDRIGNISFSDNQGLTSVSVPPSVTNIGSYAFSLCSELTNVTFFGNAPVGCASSAFYSVKNGCTATVPLGTTGWDEDGDGKWQGLVLVWGNPTVVSVEIVGPDKVVYGALDVKYICVATYTDGTTSEVAVTWHDINETGNNTCIASSTSGVLSNWATEDLAVTMQAQYTFGNTTWRCEKTVMIVENLVETYKISYLPGENGMGDPRYTTKVEGEDLTLSDAIFFREGYAQTGWATSDGATVGDYKLGGKYSVDAELTLYPVWTQKMPNPVLAGIIPVTLGGEDVLLIAWSNTVSRAKYSIISNEIDEVPDDFPYRSLYSAWYQLFGVSSRTEMMVQDQHDKGYLVVFSSWYEAGKTYYFWVAGVSGSSSYADSDIVGPFAYSMPYKVSYQKGTNGNGYNDTAYKTKGEGLILSSAIFTRDGYVQTGWTKTDGAKVNDYELGEMYVEDAAVTLYPVWSEPSPPDPIPDLGENPTAQQIEQALDGSADAKLTTNITDVATYEQYREWANRVKIKGGTAAGQKAVKNAAHAWLSFALGSEVLIESAPKDGDLKVDAFEPTATAGSFDFTVSIEDIPVGDDAKPGNLAKVFGLEGGPSLQGMSSENVDITFSTPVDGKVKFTAGPNAKNANAKTFFMKVKMIP